MCVWSYINQTNAMIFNGKISTTQFMKISVAELETLLGINLFHETVITSQIFATFWYQLIDMIHTLFRKSTKAGVKPLGFVFQVLGYLDPTNHIFLVFS